MPKNTFVVYHEDFRQDFIVKQVDNRENLGKWVDLQTHSNIVTCFDCFTEKNETLKFALTEKTNGGTMYDYIASLGLDLALGVPNSYRELIYDVII